MYSDIAVLRLFFSGDIEPHTRSPRSWLLQSSGAPRSVAPTIDLDRVHRSRIRLLLISRDVKSKAPRCLALPWRTVLEILDRKLLNEACLSRVRRPLQFFTPTNRDNVSE